MAATTRLRIVVLALIVGCVAFAIGFRLYQLQVIRCKRLQQRADDQHRSRLVVPANRGAIVDRHGRLLALSEQTRSLYAHPDRVENPETVAKQLAPLLDISRAEILRRLRSDSPFVYLQRFLDDETAERVIDLELPMGGAGAFDFQPEPRRVYPRGSLAVHIVGVATIDGNGVEGIEKVYDEDLKGDPTIYLFIRDAHSRGTREPISTPIKKPSDVVLSIDVVLQHIVERELDLAMRGTRAVAASAVLVDPVRGEVLALANRPAASANRFGRAGKRAKRNHAVVDRYEPGSTFKIVPMAAALELGKIRSDQGIFCENGVYRTGGRVIHDVSPKGTLTPKQIMTKSSNIGMVKITETMTPEELHSAIVRFGFGSRTGVELPGESAGQLRDPSEWSGFSQASIAFGQEIDVTVLQMAAAFAAIANDGVLAPPRVVLGTRDPEGRLHRSPTTPPRRVIRSETAQALGSMMENVVRNGTGRRAAIAGYRVAGKSGTAQKPDLNGGGYSKTDLVASFGGFAPADEPRLVLLVVIDSPRGEEHGGGQVAAPVFGRIMAEALRYLRVPSEDSSAPRATVGRQALLTAAPGPGWPSRDAPRPVGAREPGVVPDVRGFILRDAAAMLAAHGYGARVQGVGVVRTQQPAPGSKLQRGASCTLRLRKPATTERTDANRPPRTRRASS
jgi:cell division protein FtsI (penicillin-binding protein 3)